MVSVDMWLEFPTASVSGICHWKLKWDEERNNIWNTSVWSQGFKCHCHRYILYDVHNVTHMDAHDLMGLWDTFERYPLCLSTSRQNQEYQMIVKLKESPAVSKLKEISFHSIPECFALPLFLSCHTNTAVYHLSPDRCHVLCRHLILMSNHLWVCAFMCFWVCVWTSLGMKAHPVKPCLTAVTLNGRPSFSLSKWLTHRWTRSAVCQRKLPQTTRTQQSWPKAINTYEV